MLSRKQVNHFLLLTISVLLSSCGSDVAPNGINATPIVNNNIDVERPTLIRERIAVSRNYSPSGQVFDATPTFTWDAISGATQYQFRHQDISDDADWYEYIISASDAQCNTNNICQYTPDNVSLVIGTQRAWWLRSKSSSGVWNDWGDAYAFEVSGTSPPPPSRTNLPSGDITDTNPTFSWSAVTNATEYQFVHKDSAETLWRSYVVSTSEASCVNTSVCNYTPADFTFQEGDSRTWWVREKVNNEWQLWGNSTVFTIRGTSPPPPPPVNIDSNTPSGDTSDRTPEFSWAAVAGATEYQIGHQNTDATSWYSYTITSEQSSCSNGSVCRYTPEDITLSIGESRQWWVRAKVNNVWREWPEESTDFSITSPRIPTPSIKNNSGQIVSFVSGKCVTVQGGVGTNVTPIKQWECLGSPSQQFTLKPANQTDSYFMVAQHSGKCLSVEGGVTTNGAKIIQYTCSDGIYGNDVWKLEAVDNGYLLRAKHSNLCLNVSENRITDGADLVQWDCAAENNMIFNLGSETTDLGKWGDVQPLPIIPAAASVLATGEVLFWSSYNKMMFGGDYGSTRTVILDPITGALRERHVTETEHDMFCPGISNMASGKVMITGGSSAGKTSIYDPVTNFWETGPTLNNPRAYHTSAVLADGSVIVAGGSWAGGRFDKGVEIYQGSDWRVLNGIPTLPMLGSDTQGGDFFRADNHFWLFPWKDNLVLQAGPSKEMNWISTAGDGDISPAGTRSDDHFAINGNAVMYEPGKILTVGGATTYDGTSGGDGNTSSNAYIIEILETNVTTQKINTMNRPRVFHNSVVLPSGKVVIVGGRDNNNIVFSDNRSIMTPELFDPDTYTFTPLSPMSVPRNYHSFAVLLPDARVLVGGGGLCGACSANHGNYEIFTPPYLLDINNNLVSRPIIQSAPKMANYGETISVTTDDTVDEFVLIRMASATHSTNTDQRRIPVESRRENGSYQVYMPTERGIVLPGEYYLFAMKNGVPSIAHMIRF